LKTAIENPGPNQWEQMMKETLGAAGLIVAGLFIGGAALADPADAPVAPEAIAEIEELVQHFVGNRWIVGAELLILHGGDVVLHRGFGLRRIEPEVPMGTGALFNIRSMAKPFVGAIAQRLIDRGDLGLSDRVADYLPAFAGSLSANITIEHLLTHTSGLPDGNPSGHPSDYPTLRSIADYWGADGPTAFKPGSGFQYSDPGADVLGAVLEVVAGATLDQLTAEEVFEPLGMHDSYALITREQSADPRFASLFMPDGAGGWREVWKPGDGSIAPFTIGSGATWYCTLADYARFLQAWMIEDAGWLSPEAKRRALTPDAAMDYPTGIPGAEVRYGQMWQTYVPTSAAPDAATDDLIAFGHSGSDGTYAWVWPEKQLIALYFTQSRGQRTRVLLEPHLSGLCHD